MEKGYQACPQSSCCPCTWNVSHGHPEVTLELPEPATVGGLRRALASAYPELAPLVPHLMFAVAAEYAPDEREIAPGAGLRVAEVRDLAPHHREESPAEAVAKIESRSHSVLWDLTEEQWQRFVVPALDALRALRDEEDLEHRPDVLDERGRAGVCDCLAQAFDQLLREAVMTSKRRACRSEDFVLNTRECRRRGHE